MMTEKLILIKKEVILYMNKRQLKISKILSCEIYVKTNTYKETKDIKNKYNKVNIGKEL